MSDVEVKLLKRYPKLDQINRFIIWFDNETEEFVDGVHIENLPLEVIQKLYGCDPSNPMIEVFDVTEKEAEALSQYADITYDFMRYEYTLETNYDYKRAGSWEGGAPFPVPSGR